MQLDDGPIPVGVLIARELRDEGAIAAVCTDLTLNVLRFINPDLILVELAPPLDSILEALRIANGNRWGGLPDAVALFPDGRVAMREAKVGGKDRLNQNQHSFAKVARQVLCERLDLAVVEWGCETAC